MKIVRVQGESDQTESDKKDEIIVELTAFEQLKSRFNNGNVDDKIDIYVTTEGLTQTQYRELLKLFPLDALSRLEEALA